MKCKLIAELLNILRLYDHVDKLKNPEVLYMMGVRNKFYLKSEYNKAGEA